MKGAHLAWAFHLLQALRQSQAVLQITTGQLHARCTLYTGAAQGNSSLGSGASNRWPSAAPLALSPGDQAEVRTSLLALEVSHLRTSEPQRLQTHV